ncbi:unnamed protein product [Rhizopus stolonifer]
MRLILVFLFLVFIITYVVAEGFTKFIVGLKSPVTQAKINKVKEDVINAGGQIVDEINLGMRGLIVSFPDDSMIHKLAISDNIDFIEEDKAVFAFS